MANLWIHHVFLSASLVLLVGAVNESRVEEFKLLKDELFGYKPIEGWIVERKIHSMIKLIESGDIPAKVQGGQTLEYLKSIAYDCRDVECNLDEDLQRAERLSKRDTEAPNLENYLRICQDKILVRCKSKIYKRASAKMIVVEEQNLDTVNALAKQSDEDLRQRGYGGMLYQLNADAPNHETVLKALKKLDPAGSEEVLNEGTTLEELMNEVRLSCIEFMENLDPSVKLFPAVFDQRAGGPWKVSNWHFYLNNCKKVVDSWKRILEDAKLSYPIHLTESEA